ncbi:hypothetical protein [uncultured Virgibacillus sp.]|uniref:hypothetical protein n=1 Tax=uncultured Virgibacillus sp. TaxID=417355 RepID=UPI0019643C14|nr:hypothetical protein [uncultured Virgibacillus sp.]QRZ19378.1 hypothetical protein JUJ52_06770 [Virgibacillus sp. AGTR]
MVVPQGYDLKAFESIGHLLAAYPSLTNNCFTLLLEAGILRPLICGINLTIVCLT